MSSNQSMCCTCATLIIDTKPPLSEDEKPPLTRTLPCCSRLICASCQSRNARFKSFCPFCQLSTSSALAEDSSLPAYTPPSPAPAPPTRRSVEAQEEEEAEAAEPTAPPPPYSSLPVPTTPPTTHHPRPPDTVHPVHPSDTLSSLSLLYSVPQPLLRAHNRLFSDALLPARKQLLIPGTHYQGPPRGAGPPDARAEARKTAVRRWMVATKCAEYDVAEIYIDAAGGDVRLAVERWWEDERWVGENPVGRKGKGKVDGQGKYGGLGKYGSGGKLGGGGSLTSQLLQ